MAEEKIFHEGPMDFTKEYEVPNKTDSTLKNTTEYTEAQAARRGKFAITGETIDTTDIDSSTVVADWEARNDKAVTQYRQKPDPEPDPEPDPDPDPEP